MGPVSICSWVTWALPWMTARVFRELLEESQSRHDSGTSDVWGPMATLPCQLRQGREEVKRQKTEHSAEGRDLGASRQESTSGLSCSRTWPYPPSRSRTTGSRRSRSPPPGTAAWCSPSAGICVPAGSETRPGGGERECSWPSWASPGPAGLALSPQQVPGSGSRLWKNSAQRRSSRKARGCFCSPVFLVPGHGLDQKWELKKKSLLDGWADYPPPLP